MIERQKQACASRPMGVQESVRFWWVFGYLGVIVYGSLLPFDWRPLPWTVACDRLLNAPFLLLGVSGRADWIANIILYIPLGFLLTGWFLFGRRSVTVCVFYSTLALLFCVLVSLGVEFAQTMFPPRSVSLNDLSAEWAGSAIGVLLWLLLGKLCVRLSQCARQGGWQGRKVLLLIYMVGYFVLSLFPFDFLVSNQEIEWKLASGRLALRLVQDCDGIRCLAKITGEVVAAIPIGALLLLTARQRRPMRPVMAFLLGMALGVIIETLQFFLASGVTQGMSAVTRAIGVVAGYVGLPSRFMKLEMRRHLSIGLSVLAMLYVLMLTGLYGWWSGNWLGWSWPSTKLSETHLMPFYYHYYTSEATALASLLMRAAIFAPIGVASWAKECLAFGSRRASASGVAFLSGSLAFVLEASQLFISGRRMDIADVAIAAAVAPVMLIVMRKLLVTGLGVPVTTQPIARQGMAFMLRTTSGIRIETAMALLMLAIAGCIAAYFPLNSIVLFLGLLVYAALLWHWPNAWLVVIPALLPVLDLAPWSGWFFLDEFDLLMLVSVAVCSLRHGDATLFDAKLILPRWLLVAFLLSTGIGIINGLIPLQPISADAFASYHSHYNALRVGKGVVWALLLVFIAIRAVRRGTDVVGLFSVGMMIGVLGIGFVIVWERVTFTGLMNFATDYRVQGMFSALSSAGAQLECTLAAGMPFAFWIMARRGPIKLKLLGALAFVLGMHAAFVTFSRAVYIAAAIATVVSAMGMLWSRYRRGSQVASGWAHLTFVVVFLAGMTTVVSYSEHIKGRFNEVGADIGRRIEHWHSVLDLMDGSETTNLLGMGLGRYPEKFYFSAPTELIPARYVFMQEGANTFVRFGVGHPVFLDQFVEVEPRQSYLFSARLRSPSKAGMLVVHLCEKWLLYSVNCVASKLAFSGDAWGDPYELRLAAEEMGHGIWPFVRPVKLSLSNGGRTILDVAEISLRDSTGRNILKNGSFSSGSSYWYFSADDHFPWNIFNFWLEVFFEQGWLGLLLLLGIIFWSCAVLIQRAWSGEVESAIVLAALIGFQVTGVFDSLIDDPRMRLLLAIVLLIPTIKVVDKSGVSREAGAHFFNPDSSLTTNRMARKL